MNKDFSLGKWVAESVDLGAIKKKMIFIQDTGRFSFLMKKTGIAFIIYLLNPIPGGNS